MTLAHSIRGRFLILVLCLSCLWPMQAVHAQATPSAAYQRAYPIATRAYSAYQRNDYAAAAKGAEQAFRIDPTQGTWALLWLDSLEKQERYPDALNAAKTALQLGAPNKTDLQARAQSLNRRQSMQPATEGYRALGEQRFDDAAHQARQAVSMAPDITSHHLLLISALMALNNAAEAEQASTQALAEDDENTVALGLRGYLRQLQGKSQAANEDFDAALSQDWLSESQLKNLRLIAADASLAAGDGARTKALLAPLDPKEASVSSRLDLTREARSGTALTFANYPTPIQDCHDTPYGTACELLPAGESSDRSDAALAYAAYDRRDYADAVEHARKAYSSSPADPALRQLYITALSAGNKSDRREAREFSDQDLAKNPDDPQLLMQRGYVLGRLGEPGLAAEDFRNARNTGKAPPTAILDEAYALAADGERVAAVSVLRQAIDEDDAGHLGLNPTQRDNTRRAIAGLSREWGAIATLGFRGAQPSFSNLGGSAISTPGDALFSTAEVYWRPPKLTNQYGMLELYGRLSNTLYSGNNEYDGRRGYSCAAGTYVDTSNGATSVSRSISGWPSTIGALGLRYTLADTGITLGLERRQFLGSSTRNGYVYNESPEDDCNVRARIKSGLALHPADPLLAGVDGAPVQYQMADDAGGWMAYAAYGYYKGLEPPANKDRWLTFSTYLQGGYIWDNNRVKYSTRINDKKYGLGSGRLKRQQAFLSAETRLGTSFRLTPISDKLVLFPHLVVAADWLWQKEVAHFNHLPVAGAQDIILSSHGTNWSVGAGPGINLRYGFREDHYNATRSYLDLSVQYRVGLGGDRKRAEGLFMTLTLSY